MQTTGYETSNAIEVCRDFMNSPVITVHGSTTALAAAAIMREHGIGFLPVVDDEGRGVGVVTDRDLAVRVCAEGHAPAEVKVAAIMTTKLLTCRDGDALHAAESLMIENMRSRIGIEDAEGKLIGVLSIADLARRYDFDATCALRSLLRRDARRCESSTPHCR
jgi:CBS domain-containing protein